MNLRTMAFAAIALVAFGTSAVSFAQSTPGPQGTPPPPPVPNAQPSAPPSTEPSATEPVMTPTPTPGPVETPPPSPAASASPESGRRGRRNRPESPGASPTPSDTPEPPQFSTLDGVWEVAFQPLNGKRAIYSHLYVTQTGNDLTGSWRKNGSKTTIPFTGTFDGRLFKLTATDGASTFVFSGYEENYSDMVGLFTDGDPKHQGTPFTAAHRKRERDKTVVR